jgi:endoglucanase
MRLFLATSALAGAATLVSALAMAGCVGPAGEEGFSSEQKVVTTPTSDGGSSSHASSVSGGSSSSSSGSSGSSDGDGGAGASGDGGSGSSGGRSGDASTGSAPTTPTGPSITSFTGGVNLAGGEWNPQTLPGVVGTDYEYPTTAEVDALYAQGFRFFRIGFLWERLQPTLGSKSLDATELGRLATLVSYATAKGAYVDLDPQDFARYDGAVIGDGDGTAHPTAADFGDFWSLLATKFSADPKVIFGLMNEPNTMATELWLADANTAIASIRATGATNLVFVPGNGWTGAASWTSADDYGTANSDVMLGVKDPLENYMFEMHQYFDSDSSGTSAVCSGPSGPSRLAAATAWLEANHKKGFLAELAVSTDSSCAGWLDPTLSYLEQHQDAWAGWSWWAAGPLWGSYMFSIEPKVGAALALVPTLTSHL